jgi:ubiquinone/menaquinone biosynthesis C-methylase UbiE
MRVKHMVNSHFLTRLNYDRLSRWYDSFSASERRISKTGLRLLKVQPGEKVLEIGFGTGHAIIDLARTVGEKGSVCGIDISPGMLCVARQHVRNSNLDGRIFLQIGDATHLPYPNDHFQSVLMSFTLELFETNEIPITLSEIQRVLIPGGRLEVISLAKKDSRIVRIYEWFHAHYPHVVDCQPILVAQALDFAGYRVEQTLESSLWGIPVDAIVARKP